MGVTLSYDCLTNCPCNELEPDTELYGATEEAVELVRLAKVELSQLLAARDRLVDAFCDHYPDYGPTAVGALMGLHPSTVRGITRYRKFTD